MLNVKDYVKYVLKTLGEKADNPSIRVYINKIKIRVTFKIKTGYYLELVTPETIKLLESTKRKITRNENGEMFLIWKLLK